MEFKIIKEFFQQAISEVHNAVSPKTPFPILTGVKVTAYKDQLVLVGSSSELIIERIIPLSVNGLQVLEIHKQGSIVISAKYLSEVVRKLPDEILVKVDEANRITMQSGEIIAELHGFSAVDYPALPSINEERYIDIPSAKLTDMIKETVFAISKTDARPVLTGINISSKESKLLFSATNSQRLAVRELAIESNLKGSFTVPGTSLKELTKLLNHELGAVRIVINDSYMVFKWKSISLFSKLIDGVYPNVSSLLPTNFKTIITMDTHQLLQGIERASLFASTRKNNNITLAIQEDTKIRITSDSSEVGKIEEQQAVKTITGETDLRISLDGGFLMDALKAVKEEEVRISFGGPMKPILIEPTNNASSRHLISPVRSY